MVGGGMALTLRCGWWRAAPDSPPHPLTQSHAAPDPPPHPLTQTETLRVVDVRNNKNKVVAEACFDGQYWVNELVVNSNSDVVLMCAGRQGNMQEKGVVEILKIFHNGDKIELKVHRPPQPCLLPRAPAMPPALPPACEECLPRLPARSASPSCQRGVQVRARCAVAVLMPGGAGASQHRHALFHTASPRQLKIARGWVAAGAQDHLALSQLHGHRNRFRVQVSPLTHLDF